MLLKHLDPNLAGSLNIRTLKRQSMYALASVSKEITIGLLDGDSTNNLNILHIDQAVSLQQNSNVQLQGFTVSLYKIRNM